MRFRPYLTLSARYDVYWMRKYFEQGSSTIREESVMKAENQKIASSADINWIR